MLLNMFLIYLVALATEAAAFSSKRIGRMAADKNSLTNVGEVEKRNAWHYTGQNGRESQYIDGGVRYQGKRRIRRRGPPLQKRRQKIHTKGDKFQPCPPEGCQLPLGNKRLDSPVSIMANPLKEEIGAAKLLPQVSSEEMANVAQDNMQHAIKYRSLGNEANPVEELKEEAVGNKLLDQSPQADGDDDYGQAQEEMTQNSIKSSVEEAEANGEQILRPSEENLALVEKRHKRKYEQNFGTLAKVAGKQTEEGRLNNKKQLLVHETEARFEEGKRRCCNKYPNFGKNKLFSLNNNEITDAAEQDKEYGQDTQAAMDEETVSDEYEDTEEQEAMTEDNPSEVESGENKMEESNVHKIQQRSESAEDKYSAKQSQKDKTGLEQKTQKFASGYENKQPLKSLSKPWRTARRAGRKCQQKKPIGGQDYLSQPSAELTKQSGYLSSKGDDRKSSLKGRSEGEEGGERDEEETLDSENVGDLQGSNDRASALGSKSEQQQPFDQDNDEQNLEEQSAINEQNEAEADEAQEAASGTKYESGQAAVDEQSAAEGSLEASENEESQSEESEVPKKRQVAEGLDKEESKQAVADEQPESVSNYGASASENNGGKITIKRADSERQATETGQAMANNDKESGEAESETSSLDSSEESQSLTRESMEDEREKRQLRNKASSNNEKTAKLRQDSEAKIDELQPQAETRIQRELSKSEKNNEAPMEESQALEQEGSKEVNAEQQVSLSESSEEQYEPLNEERETINIASSETADELTRENREIGKQDVAKVKCCRNKNQPSLANEHYRETAEVASEAETDTQSSLENSNQDVKLSAADESAIMTPHETEGEASVEEYQELEPNSEEAGEEDLQPERESSKE